MPFTDTRRSNAGHGAQSRQPIAADVRPLGQAKVRKYFWHSKSNKEKTKNEKQKEREKNNK